MPKLKNVFTEREIEVSEREAKVLMTNPSWEEIVGTNNIANTKNVASEKDALIKEAKELGIKGITKNMSEDTIQTKIDEAKAAEEAAKIAEDEAKKAAANNGADENDK